MGKARATNFLKVEGAGNDFVLIPHPPQTIRDAKGLEHFCRTMCAPRFGIGADGMLFLWPSQPSRKTQSGQRWQWFFLNADGSRAAFCGNAARTAVVFFSRLFPKEKKFWWETDSEKEIWGRRTEDGGAEVSWEVSAQATAVTGKLLETVRGLCGKALECAHLVQAGVPHLVLISGEPWARELRVRVAPALRAHPALGPEGANVTFLCSSNGECVTFERGVEGETLACGSGAVAAACALETSRGPQPEREHRFTFPGGELKVRLGSGLARLVGPARIVFEGTLPEDILK